MNQARDIMERRVNGSGVVGAQVQIDGSSQLVVTVPGQANLDNLTRSAVMNIRPVIAGYPAVSTTVTTGASGSESTETSGSGAETSGAESTASGAKTTAKSETGKTTATSKSSASATAEVGNQGTKTTSPTTTESGQGLRAQQGAVATTASGETAAADQHGRQRPPPTSTDAAASGTESTGTAATSAARDGGRCLPRGQRPEGPHPAGRYRRRVVDDVGDRGPDLRWPPVRSPVPTSTPYLGLDDPNKPLISCEQDGTYIYLLDKTLIPGDQIDTASAGIVTERVRLGRST